MAQYVLVKDSRADPSASEHSHASMEYLTNLISCVWSDMNTPRTYKKVPEHSKKGPVMPTTEVFYIMKGAQISASLFQEIPITVYFYTLQNVITVCAKIYNMGVGSVLIFFFCIEITT